MSPVASPVDTPVAPTLHNLFNMVSSIKIYGLMGLFGDMLAEKDLRINEHIRVREVRLIKEDGEQQVLWTSEALSLAREQGLDLVEVAPQANPPVVKIMNYGKFKFENEKKGKESKKKQKLLKLKEIRMQPKIDDHDLDFKSKHVKGFLNEGNKVKVTIRFRGRELAHTELGKVVLDDVLARIEGEYVLDKPPTMEGKFMSMILSPKLKKQVQAGEIVVERV